MSIEEEIRQHLTSGNQKLGHDLDGAEQSYRKAMDLADRHRHSALARSAFDGLIKVRNARSTASSPTPAKSPSTKLSPTDLETELQKTHSEERRLILLKLLIEAGVHKVSDASTQEQYNKLLEDLRQRLLRQAKLVASEGNTLIKGIEMLEGESVIRSAHGEEAAARAVVSDLQNGAVKEALEKYRKLRETVPVTRDSAGDGLRLTSDSGENSTEVGKQNPQISVDDQTTTRVTQLIARADARLRRETTNNYKEALTLLEEALGLSESNPALKNQIEQRISEVQGRYEEFRAKFGELITARQLDKIEEELITLQQLINSGRSIGPDGEDLVDRLAALFGTLRTRLLRVATERIALVDQLLISGCDYLNQASLERARGHLDAAVRLLYGEEIGNLAAAVTTPREGSGSLAADSAARTAAIQGLRSDLQKHPDIRSRLSDYEKRRTEIESVMDLIIRCAPIYGEAERFYNEGNYQQAHDRARYLTQFVGEQMRSRLITLIEEQAREKRTNELRPKLEIVVERAKKALSAGDIASAEHEVEQALLIEPTFQSDEIEQLRATARQTREDARKRDRELRDALSSVEQLRRKGGLEEAEVKSRELLRDWPGHSAAQALLDRILYARVDQMVGSVERAIGGIDIKLLKQLGEELVSVRGSINEVGDLAQQRRLAERYEETKGNLEERIRSLEDAERRRRRFDDELEAAERYLKLEQFEDAERCLQEARHNVVDGQETRHIRQETELRIAWTAFLKRKLQQALNQQPAQPDTVRELVEAIKRRGFDDSKTGAGVLLRQASEFLSRVEAINALNRGDFAKAIELLSSTNLADQAMRDLLATALRSEIQRLESDRDWAKLIELLQDRGTDYTSSIRHARGELALEEATKLLRDEQFQACESKLDEVDRQQSSTLTERSGKLRTDLTRAREIYRRIEQLVDKPRALASRLLANNDRVELLGMITILKQALADQDLKPDALQRGGIQKLCLAYEQRYGSVVAAERQQLLRQGRELLKADKLAEALEKFGELHKITPGGSDAEAQEGVSQVKQRADELRQGLVEDVRQLLNLGQNGQRGVRPAQISDSIARAEKLRSIDPNSADVQLNTQIGHLKEAERLCSQADEALKNARRRWADLRATAIDGADLNSRDFEGDIERAVGLFSSKTYIHIELDRSSVESVPQRFSRDLKDLRDATSHQREFQQSLNRDPYNPDELVNIFEQLGRVEKRLYETTIRLIDNDQVTSLHRPTTNDDCYPRQNRIISQISDQIGILYQNEIGLSDLEQLRANLERRSGLEGLLKRLDPEGRFRLSPPTVGTGRSLTPKQLQTWQQAFEEGKQQIGQAQKAKEEAEQAEQRKLLLPAEEAYERSKAAYQKAEQLLNDLAQLNPEHSALKSMSEHARTHLADASTQIGKLADCVERCRKSRQQAVDLITAAEQALDRGDKDDALEKASKARNIDPALSERADTLLRAVNSNQDPDETSSRVFLVVILLILAAAVSLGIVFGPGLWAWLSEFLFPVTILISW